MSHPIRPFTTRPHVAELLWGGTRLGAWLDLPQPRPRRIAEVWPVFDANPIRDGDLAGFTLREATEKLGEALIGSRAYARYGADFPLLVKFLDAAAPLSVQVHPDDAYAHRHEAASGFHGKDEAWYVLDAAPGATVAHGLIRPVSRDEFLAAVAARSLDDLLQRILVAAGEAIIVPAGTIHTIGPGILLYEIQQKSDLTYRVYDFGRRDPITGLERELHLDKALDVAHLGPADPPAPPTPLAEGRELLASCRSFALERWTVDGEVAGATDPGSVEILTLVSGSAELRWDHDAMDLRRGATVVLPAALGGYRLGSRGNRLAKLLRAYVPDSG